MQSEQFNEVIGALIAFQSNPPTIVKGGKNGHLNNRYAKLEDMMPAILPELAKHGLCITHRPGLEDGKPVLYTHLVHESGQWIGCVTPLMADKQTCQGLGGAMTYMRRYSVAALLGIVADADDDGETAKRGQAVAEARERRKQPPKKESRRDNLIRHIESETNIDRMGAAKAAVEKFAAGDEPELTEAEARECLQAIGTRTAELAKPVNEPAPELFETAPINDGVGV